MKIKNYLCLFFIATLLSCNTSTDSKETASSENYEMDRSILPIQGPQHDAITEMDARIATAPEPFGVTAPEGAPNVVIVLIDDIGFSATEPFGGAIETPTFDKLADNGLRFNRFHTTALCSPTRASLLSGRNHHNINVGSVMEVATGFPGNNGERPDNAKYVSEILRHNGFSTAAFGKWHETAPWEVSVSGPYFRWPSYSGFDKFYGFIGGETNQWDPFLHDGTAPVELEIDEDYHFTTDMTDKAINWMKFQQALTPDKPFMMYYAPGAVHAPHHVTQEWIDKYKGTFDDGWDVLREETLQRQIEMGIVPEGTVLAPKPDDIKDWDSLNENEKKLFIAQIETYAGFMSHTDHEVGRLVDALEEINVLDNTMFIYIMGDNGSSAEGGMDGTFNEMIHLNGNFEAETVEDMLEKVDVWGGPDSYPHMAAGWAVATDAPFSWTKQVAADFGGTRNGMVIHWPNGINAKGELRHQWHHVNDIVPTILEATNLPEAKMINGVKQIPMDGVSMAYAFDNVDAEDRHTTQYFEMFGNRGIYQDGWLARTVHKLPWGGTLNTLQEDKWELFNIEEDFSLANDLSNENPDKLSEMQELFREEAIKNNVFPIDDRLFERFNPALAGRPDLMGDRKSLTLGEGMTGMMENAFLNVKNNSVTIDADLEVSSNDSGIILCQGGKFGGWALYLDNGKLGYTYNWYGLETYNVISSIKVPDGKTNVRMDFAYDGDGAGKGGMASLFINDEKVGEARVEQTQPSLFSGDETADVGEDGATQVVDVFKNKKDSKFTGKINSVTVSIGRNE